MVIEKCTKPSFTVIGKQGSTHDGQGFVQRLWEDANAHFSEVQHLAKKDEKGNLCGVWGVMSDFSLSFRPWENGFTQGLYLAGVECIDSAEPPAGWTKWVIPEFDYLYVACESEDTFSRMIAYLKQNHIELAGAVQDFTCPKTGKNYQFFPIKKG